MSVKIYSVKKDGLAWKKGVRGGDLLISVNGEEINDVLDYDFYMTEKKVELKILSAESKTEKRIEIRKGEYEDIGLEFETYLMDKQKSCRNKCVFCFIDQLPKGMREALYFKDD
ncbi:MAG: radical SAM protein, partial [Oscillospiraceae bacterium]|nr:radical SAM protein [Oscillospiraceae bacterium]